MPISEYRLLPLGLMVMFLLVWCGSPTDSNGTGSQPGPSAQPPTSSVNLQVGATHYQADGTILVTIKNQSNETITFADHQTNCSVLLLERQIAGTWKPVSPCLLKTSTRLHSLAAGKTLEIKLTASQQWPTGYYQARLDYWAGTEPKTGTLTTVHSSMFNVG